MAKKELTRNSDTKTAKKGTVYLNEPYARILIPDEKGNYFAEMLEFPGCVAEGKTPEKALKNLENAAIDWIEASLAIGHHIPDASLNQGFGGKIALRLPRSLHKKAVMLAERDGTSLNQFLLSAVAARVGAEDFLTGLLEKYESSMTQVVTHNTINLFISPQIKWAGSSQITDTKYEIIADTSKEVMICA